MTHVLQRPPASRITLKFNKLRSNSAACLKEAILALVRNTISGKTHENLWQQTASTQRCGEAGYVKYRGFIWHRVRVCNHDNLFPAPFTALLLLVNPGREAAPTP